MDAIKHFHPVVGFSFFMLMIVLSLASMQPVFQIVSFIAAVAYAISLSGIKGFIKGNWWILILIAVVALFNAVFGGQGLSVIASLNLGFMKTNITIEGLTYGIIMGFMLANVMLWFFVLGKLSSTQGFIELFSKLSPTAGMMVSRITVFIPELLDHASMVDRAQQSISRKPKAVSSGAAAQSSPYQLVETDAGGTSEKTSRKAQIAYGSSLSSHLMEWGMEKSLTTANSMVARGYGSRKRTSYRRTRLTRRDLIPLCCIVVLGLVSLVCNIWMGTEYQYYPYLTELYFTWMYIPFVLLCVIPIILQVGEELAWWRSR